MTYDKGFDYAGFTLDEQIRAADETYDSAAEFCSCEQCEAIWGKIEIDYADF